MKNLTVEKLMWAKKKLEENNIKEPLPLYINKIFNGGSDAKEVREGTIEGSKKEGTQG